jgi:hypothetical protein
MVYLNDDDDFDEAEVERIARVLSGVILRTSCAGFPVAIEALRRVLAANVEVRDIMQSRIMWQ